MTCSLYDLNCSFRKSCTGPMTSPSNSEEFSVKVYGNIANISRWGKSRYVISFCSKLERVQEFWVNDQENLQFSTKICEEATNTLKLCQDEMFHDLSLYVRRVSKWVVKVENRCRTLRGVFRVFYSILKMIRYSRDKSCLVLSSRNKSLSQVEGRYKGCTEVTILTQSVTS